MDNEEKSHLVSKILVALLKHQVTRVIGEEMLGILAGELAALGIGQLDAWLSRQLGNQAILDQINKASEKADACFLEECQDPDLQEAIRSLPLRGLPELGEALLTLPDQVSDVHLSNAIRLVMERDWRGLSAEKIDHAANLYLSCIRRALLSVEKYALPFIFLTMEQIIAKVSDLQKVVNGISERLKTAPAPHSIPFYQPPQLPPDNNLPAIGVLPPGSKVPFKSNAIFTGREVDLLALKQALLDENLNEPEVGRAAVLTGMGGIGKTQLAVEFCHRYGRFFHGVLWLRADQDIQAAIVEYSAGLGLEVWSESPSSGFERALIALQQTGPHLVVLDNAEYQHIVQTWLPQLANARVLITSRIGLWPPDLGLYVHSLETLPRQESISLLCKLAPRLRKIEKAQLNLIPEKLGDLPLALDLAGRYLSDRIDLDPAGYLIELDEAGWALKHTSLRDWVEHNPTLHSTNLAASFTLSWTKLSEDETLARQFYLTCAFCPPNTPIPLNVFLTTADVSSKNPSIDTARALRHLYRTGLLVATEHGPSIHPLMREFADLELSEIGKAKFKQGLETNILQTLDDPINKVANALNAGEALLALTNDPEWRISKVRGPVLSSLVGLMTNAGAPISDRRRAALLLTRLEWLKDIASLVAEEMLDYLELAGRYVHQDKDRQYILNEITIPILESETKELTPLQRAQFLVFQAAMRAQLSDLDQAKADYEQACKIANTWKTVGVQASPADLIRARVRLGLGHHLAIQAEEHPLDPNEARLLQDQAVDLFLASLDSAQRYGQDPVLQAYIFGELSWIYASLQIWSEAESQYRQALNILDQANITARSDPEAVAICRAKILGTASLVRWEKGNYFPENSKEAAAEYQDAYQLVREEIKLLNEEVVRETEEGAIAQLNAGDYLRILAEQPEANKTDLIEKACEHWAAARMWANRLGVPDIVQLAIERLSDPGEAIRLVTGVEPAEE